MCPISSHFVPPPPPSAPPLSGDHSPRATHHRLRLRFSLFVFCTTPAPPRPAPPPPPSPPPRAHPPHFRPRPPCAKIIPDRTRRHAQTRLLRNPRRSQGRPRRRDPQGPPQAGAAIPPGRQQEQPQIRGEVQGSPGSLRRALRR